MWRAMQVRATEDITENNFPESGNVHTHALRGDVGEVQGVDGEWLTVTWTRIGTTIDYIVGSNCEHLH